MKPPIAGLIAAFAGVAVWCAFKKRTRTRRKPRVVGVGNAALQERFIRKHAAFLEEYPNVNSLLTRAFIRTLTRPSEEEVERLRRLPETDPAVVAFENKMMADLQVFYLGRTAADDFGEICVLAGNGYGVGALKILRGMYERIVTAAYVAKNPSEARVFAEDDAIKKWKLWQDYVTVMPELSERYTADQVRDLEERYKAIRAKRKVEICRKCGQPITVEAWTRVTMPDMAKKADAGLAGLCGSCYLEPTFHSHPTAYGLGVRLRETEEGGYIFRDTTEDEADRAVILAHNLILRLLGLQDEYFSLGMEEDIRQCLKAFLSVWGSKSAP